MDYWDKKFAAQLLAAPHLIACIHEEDIGPEPGIMILYNEGTSFWRPLDSKEEQHEVWEALCQMKPAQLTEFDDVLFDPSNVKEVAFIEGEDRNPILEISFHHHRRFSKLYFEGENYKDFEQATVELIAFLSDHQHRRSNVWFVNETNQ
mgnify:CR=1 FL=1|jgi:hypothetical protein